MYQDYETVAYLKKYAKWFWWDLQILIGYFYRDGFSILLSVMSCSFIEIMIESFMTALCRFAFLKTTTGGYSWDGKLARYL